MQQSNSNKKKCGKLCKNKKQNANWDLAQFLPSRLIPYQHLSQRAQETTLQAAALYPLSQLPSSSSTPGTGG